MLVFLLYRRFCRWYSRVVCCAAKNNPSDPTESKSKLPTLNECGFPPKFLPTSISIIMRWLKNKQTKERTKTRIAMHINSQNRNSFPTITKRNQHWSVPFVFLVFRQRSILGIRAFLSRRQSTDKDQQSHRRKRTEQD